MARIFFTQHQNMNLLSGESKLLGGAVVQTCVWIKAFYELGHEVVQGKLENDHKELLPEYSWVNTISIYHPEKNKRRFCWYTHRLPSFFMALKKSQCNVVYESIPHWYSIYLSIFCRFLKIKHIIRVANDNMMDDRILLEQSKWNVRLIFLSLRFCDFILVQNDYQFKTLKNKFPKKKILKIFNPIVLNREYLQPKVARSEYIAWVGNFRYQKNFQLLFNLCKILTFKVFKIAGSPNFPIDAETKEYYDLLKGLPNVQFVGDFGRKEIFSFVGEAKFLLNTSRFEGFSNTFLEAMAVGTPILSTPSVNPDGIIDRYNLGIIYKDEHDLKDILNKLSKEDYLVKSENCIAFVKENHDHLTLAKRILEFSDIQNPSD